MKISDEWGCIVDNIDIIYIMIPINNIFGDALHKFQFLPKSWLNIIESK